MSETLSTPEHSPEVEAIASEVWAMLSETAEVEEWPKDWDEAKAQLSEDDRQAVDFVYRLATHFNERERKLMEAIE